MIIISRENGEVFLNEQVAATTEVVEDEGKVLLFFDKNAEWRSELEQLIASSPVSAQTALQPVDYAPIELQEMTLKISSIISQENSGSNKVAGIDPEASEQAIYVLVKEELNSDVIDRITAVFPNVEFVPVSESTEFSPDL